MTVIEFVLLDDEPTNHSANARRAVVSRWTKGRLAGSVLQDSRALDIGATGDYGLSLG